MFSERDRTVDDDENVDDDANDKNKRQKFPQFLTARESIHGPHNR